MSVSLCAHPYWVYDYDTLHVCVWRNLYICTILLCCARCAALLTHTGVLLIYTHINIPSRIDFFFILLSHFLLSVRFSASFFKISFFVFSLVWKSNQIRWAKEYNSVELSNAQSLELFLNFFAQHIWSRLSA